MNDSESGDAGERKREILVIDDTPQNLRLLHDLLTGSGYVTRSAPNGRMGIQSARLRKPDLVLLDIAMPEMNGFEVCRIFKEDPELRDVPVLFISARGESESIVRAFQEGGVDYVTKPFELEEVEARIRTHLQICELREKLEEHNRNLEKKVEERTRELEEANQRLKSLDKLKSRFLTMISHQLRTPINGVLGVADLIVYEQGENELTNAYGKSRERLLRLLDQCNQISELESVASARADLSDITLANFIELIRSQKLIAPSWSDGDMSEEALSRKLVGGSSLIGRIVQQISEMSCHMKSDMCKDVRLECERDFLRVSICVDTDCMNYRAAKMCLVDEEGEGGKGPLESLGLEPIIVKKLFDIIGGKLYFGEEGSQALVAEFAFCDSRSAELV